MTSSRLVAVAAGAWNVLTILVFAGIVALLASGYRATREWEQGVSTRIAHQTEESADLILKAISRDMHGAQAMILANRDWDARCRPTLLIWTSPSRWPPYLPGTRIPNHSLHGAAERHGIIFFSRSTRLPPWMSHQNRPTDSPISTVVDPLIGEHVRQRVLSSIAAQQRYAVFDTQFAGVPYQVVARMTYADPLREHLESVSGFTVNLDWVRTQYFSDILRDVGPRPAAASLRMSHSSTTTAVP